MKHFIYFLLLACMLIMPETGHAERGNGKHIQKLAEKLVWSRGKEQPIKEDIASNIVALYNFNVPYNIKKDVIKALMLVPTNTGDAFLTRCITQNYQLPDNLKECASLTLGSFEYKQPKDVRFKDVIINTLDQRLHDKEAEYWLIIALFKMDPGNERVEKFYALNKDFNYHRLAVTSTYRTMEALGDNETGEINTEYFCKIAYLYPTFLYPKETAQENCRLVNETTHSHPCIKGTREICAHYAPWFNAPPEKKKGFFKSIFGK